MPPKKLNQSVEPESPSVEPESPVMSQEKPNTEVTDRPAESVESTSTTSTSKDRKAANFNKSLQRRAQPTYDDEDSELDDFVVPPPRKNRRMVPVHQSRIADRPIKKGAEDSSLKIKIELDLEVEVEIYARVKGDITIGLM